MTSTLVIADDEAPIRSLIRVLVERTGCARVVGEAADGRQTVDLVRQHDPDLLLLDLVMPVMDGLEVLQELGDEARPRVVVLSGFADPDTHRQAMEFGAASFLVKGRDFARLPDVLTGSQTSA